MTPVQCERCLRDMPAGQGTLCLTCSLVATSQPQREVPTYKVNYNLGPALAIAALLVAGAIGGVWYYKRREVQERLAHDFPIAATAGDRRLLDVDGRAWLTGKARLLASLKAFDPAQADARATAAPCTIPFDPVSSSQVDSSNTDSERNADGFTGRIAAINDPDRAAAWEVRIGPDLLERVQKKLSAIASVRDRKRFRSLRVRDEVLGAIDDPALVVIKLDVDTSPEVIDLGSFAPGVREGHAYAFDRETGELRCVGAFHAESSSEVSALVSIAGAGNEHEALGRDLDAQMEREIARSLRAVR
jgi:hypothetical protein